MKTLPNLSNMPPEVKEKVLKMFREISKISLDLPVEEIRKKSDEIYKKYFPEDM